MRFSPMSDLCLIYFTRSLNVSVDRALDDNWGDRIYFLGLIFRRKMLRKLVPVKNL